MCGICGFLSKECIGMDILKKMNKSLAHRGPDDQGEEIYKLSNSRWVGLAQRRLSIIDLTQKGHQPMHSNDKRVSVVFNGEIYNYKELQNQLKGYNFNSQSDTEVIIASYLKWGLNFVKKINGMFAIALLDRKEEKLYLIRDRIGKKPIYYCNHNNQIIFASELKAILLFPDIKKEINTNNMGLYFNKRYIAAPNTIYKNIYKLEAGSILCYSNDNVKKWKYWDVSEKYNILRKDKINNYGQAKEDLKKLLFKAVDLRLSADVSVGAFLSGGFDSSLICAIAQQISKSPIKTFSVGFYDKSFDEAIYAKKIAEYLGTEHEEMYISEKEMLSLVESIPVYYDEPFADASQIPTMLVSSLAKKKVSVVLSGDGGDEFFGGYNIYQKLHDAQRKMIQGRMIYWLQKSFGEDKLFKYNQLPIEYKIVSEKSNKEARTQLGVLSYIQAIEQLLEVKNQEYYYEYESKYQEKSYEMTRMLLDMDTYLTDDILVKVDRATMKYALECRCPILDYNIMEYSYRLPLNFKIHKKNKKRILKDIAYEYIPCELLERPKKGFYVPLDRWIRGPLKERILDWTDRDFLRRQGIFNPDNTREFINNYMDTGDKGEWSGGNFSRIVWSYFIFQQWYEAYM